MAPAPECPAGFSARPILAGLPCLIVPFLLCWHGFGAYVRYGWLMLIPALIGVSCIAISIVRAQRKSWQVPFFLGFALLSWGAGVQARTWRCESTCRTLEPALDALRQFHSEHGSFPTQLTQVPEFRRLAEAGRITLREGRSQGGMIQVNFFNTPDVMIYLGSSDYLCVVLLERPMIMSFTRFNILRQDATSPKWTEDRVVWTLEKINPRL